MSNYVIESMKAEQMLPDLQKDWDRLSRDAEHPNVFTTYDWFQAWYRFFAQTESSKRLLNLLILKRQENVVGIAPFIRIVSSRCGFVVRRLQFQTRLPDYNDLVLGDDPEGQTKALVEFFARKQNDWDLIDLRDLRDIGGSLACMESALKRTHLSYKCVPEEEGRCPFLSIDGSWSEILGRRSRSTRHTFRLQQNRLNKMSAEGLRVRLLENPYQEPGLLEKMIGLEFQKRVGGQLAARFLKPYSEVFAELFGTLGPKGWLCVAVMELGDQLLAWQLMFRCGNKLWGYLTAYDHSYSRLSPSTMLLPPVVDYCQARGYAEYDFLRGEETYKTRWTNDVHHTYRLLIWDQRLTSRIRKFVYCDLKDAIDRALGARL